MSNQVSNLYAARIFAEHPLALWALDDDFSFISKLSIQDKSIINWDLSNITSASASNPVGLILENEQTDVLTVISASSGYQGSASGTAINSITDLDPDKKTLSINAFAYNYNNVSSFDIGFIHSGSTFFTSYTPEREEVWTKISHTLNIPTGNVDIYPYFKVNYDNASLGNSGSDYNFSINALSVGQWSELFHYQSTGTISASIDPNILGIISASSSLSASSITGVVADSYGIAESKNGYYIVEKNRTLAYSDNFPITFGATNITNITYPLYGNIPSMVFPAEGFLNESGRYKETTLEFWLRAHTNATTPIKIVGPLTTTDGIYIDKDFITIKIGPYRKSYFVGKWYRPMLIDFRYNIDTASLLINGDLVIDMDIDQNKIILSDKDYNYIGVYGNENIYPFEIDALAIYPYIVQEQTAKKRFVYAQGVESANNIVSNFKGDSFQVDFPYAKYTSTINYPDMNNWNSGFFNNSISTSKYLSNPEYSLPEIIFSEPVNLDNFLIDNYNSQQSDFPFIKLRPNSNYNNITSSINFNSLNVLNAPVKSIFGIFRSPTTLTDTKEILMYFSNNLNNNNFSVKISNAGVEYFYNDTKIFDYPVLPNSVFIAGFDLDAISQEYLSTLNNFFSNPQNISFSLGGNQSSMFSGKIFNFTFNNRMFTDKDLVEYKLDNGFFNPDIDVENLIYYIGNYTLHPQILSNSLTIDVGSSGYWEDSIPLSYFGKFVEDKNKNPYYDLDLLQFNIDSPSSLILQKDQIPALDGGLSTSLDFKFYFDNGSPTTSASNFIFSFDGGNPETVEFIKYLTDEQLDILYKLFLKENNTIKTYITLQNYTDVGNIPYTEYSNTKRIGADRVLDLDEYTTTQINNTKFEVTDRTIIFPPKELVDFAEYYITVHIEISSKSINKAPIKLRKMSISSLAYDESSFYSINSPDGYKLYPFNRYGDIYAYKLKNPFTIYKDSTSYMHNTGDSGISVLPYESSATRGITIPINQQLATEYLLGGVQFWSFYNKGETIEETVQVGKISTRDRSYDIKLVPESNYTRAKMVLFDEDTNNEATGIVFYQNGSIVDNPYIQPLSWNAIIITFEESIDLPSSVGQLEIYEGLMVNNIAFYKKSSDVLGSIFIDNEWRDLRADTTWGSWYQSGAGIWEEIEGQSEPLTFIVDGKSIYDSTFGVSSVVGRDNSTLSIDSDGVTIITGTIWEEYSGRPV
jgi:hypothetical protein